MSIASEIERLKNAKTSIASAIEEKGVAVPAETSIDEYGNYVSLIPSGDYATKEELEALSNTANADTRVEYVDNVLKTLGGTEIVTGNAKITFGSYVGTGTYGANNPNSLTFDFAPKIVWIYAVFGYFNALKTPSGNYVSNILPMDFIPTEYTENLGLHLGSYGNESWGKKSADGKTLSWYSTDGVDAQGNKTGYRYFYMAMA